MSQNLPITVTLGSCNSENELSIAVAICSYFYYSVSTIRPAMVGQNQCLALPMWHLVGPVPYLPVMFPRPWLQLIATVCFNFQYLSEFGLCAYHLVYLVFCYRMLHGLCDISLPVEFPCRCTRGNNLKLAKHFCCTDIRKYTFLITESLMRGTVCLMISLCHHHSVSVFKKRLCSVNLDNFLLIREYWFMQCVHRLSLLLC